MAKKHNATKWLPHSDSIKTGYFMEQNRKIRPLSLFDNSAKYIDMKGYIEKMGFPKPFQNNKD